MKIKNSKIARYIAIALIALLSYGAMIGYLTIGLEVESHRGMDFGIGDPDSEIYRYADMIVRNKADNLFYAKIGNDYFRLDRIGVLEEEDEIGDSLYYNEFTYVKEVGKYVADRDKQECLDIDTMTAGNRKVHAIGSLRGSYFLSNHTLPSAYETYFVYKEERLQAAKTKEVSDWAAISEETRRLEYEEMHRAETEHFLPIYSEYAAVLAVSTTILILLLVTFVFISVGHDGSDEVKLTVWDRMPYLLHLCIVAAFAGVTWIPVAVLGEYYRGMMAVPVVYVGGIAVCFTVLATGWAAETTIVRLKAKCFWKTTAAACFIRWAAAPVKAGWAKLTGLYHDYKDDKTGVNLVIAGTEAIVHGEADLIDISKIDYHYTDFARSINALAEGKTHAVSEMLKSERMRSELITNVSHDIKTPLTSIISYADLLSKKDLGDAEAKEYLEVITSQSARLKTLLEDLIEASKASSGVLPVNTENIELGVLLTQMLSEYDDRFKAKNLTILSNIPEDLGSISTDPKHLSRVIGNLLSNIAKYSMENGRVYVDVKAAPDGRHVITFKNTSAEPLNISADELMERFMRGDSSRSKEGSGLGLSIAASLMELIGGRLQLTIDGDLFKAEVILT